MISHYRLVRRLDLGGMGEVFLARATELDRPPRHNLLKKMNLVE